MRVLPQALHGLGVALEGAGSQDGAAKLSITLEVFCVNWNVLRAICAVTFIEGACAIGVPFRIRDSGSGGRASTLAAFSSAPFSRRFGFPVTPGTDCSRGVSLLISRQHLQALRTRLRMR